MNGCVEFLWRRVRRMLYLLHRWLGIACCVLFVLWFVSGLVMLYVRFPRLVPQERIDGLSVIEFKQLEVSPQAALDALGLHAANKITLEYSVDQPVWRVLDGDGNPHVVAAGGMPLPQVTPERAVKIAQAFGRSQARYLETVVDDQWTLPNANDFDNARPLHRIALEDGKGTQLYVSAKTGEVVRDSNTFERRWTLFGTLLHYYTYAPIRRLPGVWRPLVMWTSGIGMVVASTGVLIGLLRVRLRRRYRGGASPTPYRGWMAWHHLVGVVGGISIVTWVFSGWFGMGPNRWLVHTTPASAAAQFGGAQAQYRHDIGLLQQMAGDRHGIKAVEAAWYDHQPVWIVTEANGERRAFCAQDGRAITVTPEVLAETARQTYFAPLARTPILIETPDRYWYHRHVPPALPVWRLILHDDAGTWLHVDARTGQLLASSTSSSRLRRWLYNGLHSLDFPRFMKTLPWYVTIWILSLAGLLVSVSGIVIGWRRLRR